MKSRGIRYALVGVLGFGFLIRLFLLVRSPGFDATLPRDEGLPREVTYFRGVPCQDSQEYKALALNMMRHHRFSWNSEPVTFRTPGYPAFIAAVYSVFGVREWVVMLFQVLLSTASIFLIYLIGRDIWNEWAGIVAASLFAVDFSSIFYSSLFLSETLFLFILLGGSWLFLRHKLPYLGLIFGISALVRPIALYLFIPMLFFQRNLKSGIMFAVFFFLPIAPWMARNFSIYHAPVLVSLQGYDLLFHNIAVFESQQQGIDIKDTRRELGEGLDSLSTNPLQLCSQAQKIAVGKIMTNPWKYGLFHIIGGMSLFLSTKADDVVLKLCGANINQTELLRVLRGDRSLFFRVGLLLLAGLEIIIIIGSIILAVIGLMRSPHWPSSFLMVLTVYLFALSGGGLLEGRLRFPMLPYIYLMASGFFFSKKKVDFLFAHSTHQ
jgi:hypothetical protein